MGDICLIAALCKRFDFDYIIISSVLGKCMKFVIQNLAIGMQCIKMKIKCNQQI